MIKRKDNVDGNVAFEVSCQKNNIFLTDKGANLNPVSYIDPAGKVKVIESLKKHKRIINNEFKVGDTVRVHGKIKKGSCERIQVFEGTVVKKQGEGTRAKFTVRKNFNGVGVEKTWSTYSPDIERVEVVRNGRARGVRLRDLRKLSSKGVKVKAIVR